MHGVPDAQVGARTPRGARTRIVKRRLCVREATIERDPGELRFVERRRLQCVPTECQMQVDGKMRRK